jgi:hypothetical protein
VLAEYLDGPGVSPAGMLRLLAGFVPPPPGFTA